MGEAGLSGGHRRRRRVYTTRRDPLAQPAPDLVQRDFAATAPNQLWVADLTAVPTAEEFLALAVLLAVCSRRVVGWSMADQLRAELVGGALERAVWNRHPASGILHHCDHGSQYPSLLFGHRCQQVGISCSLGSVGDCYANALAASFFAPLQGELLAGRTFRTQLEARTALFDYIAVFSNRHRRHAALGFQSPDAFARSSPTTTPRVP